MAIRIAGEDVEYLPAQQLLQVGGGIGGSVPDQPATVRKRGAAVLLVLPFVSESQSLAEIFLVQPGDPAAFLP